MTSFVLSPAQPCRILSRVENTDEKGVEGTRQNRKNHSREWVCWFAPHPSLTETSLPLLNVFLCLLKSSSADGDNKTSLILQGEELGGRDGSLGTMSSPDGKNPTDLNWG